MIHVFIVSEDRAVVKSIRNHLSISYNAVAHTVTSGKDILADFSNINPDIVILDSRLSFPYTVVLRQFNQVKNSFFTLILNEENQIENETSTGNFINYKKVNSIDFHNILREMYTHVIKERESKVKSQIKWHNHTIDVPIVGIHYILLIKDLNNLAKKEIEENIKVAISKMVSIYDSSIVVNEQKDVLCIISFKNQQHNETIKRLAKSLMEELEGSYGIVVSHGVGYKLLQEEVKLVLKLEEYAYFFENEIIYSHPFILSRERVHIEDVYAISIMLLKSILSGDKGHTIGSLRELYLRKLKFNMELQSIELVHTFITVINDLLCLLLGTEVSIDYRMAKTVEMDYELVLAQMLKHIDVINQDLVSPLVKKSLIFLYENLCKEISLSNAAAVLSVNKNYLSRIFKRDLDVSFNSVLQIIRVNIACYLITYSQWDIRVISQWVGYQDPHYFSQIYKRSKGQSPKVYREQRTLMKVGVI